MKNELFDGLVTNAIEFFTRALDANEIKAHPKYSLVNFATGVELILKARLMHEHWTLILEDPSKADYIKFKEGDFKSISMTTAIERINKIIGENIGKNNLGQIEEIRKYRNRIMHFFDQDYLSQGHPLSKNIENVVKEQMRTWYRLYLLIQTIWKKIFADHFSELEKLNKAILGNNVFLATKFEELKPNIDNQKANGIIFIECKACEFISCDTNAIDIEIPIITDTHCLVCENKLPAILFVCQGTLEIGDCGVINVYSGDQEDVKCKCGNEMPPSFIIDTNFESELDQREDEKSSIYRISCIHCNEETIIINNEHYKCLSCFEEYTQCNHCDWCGAPWAVNSEEDLSVSYLNGCGICSGNPNPDF